MTYISPNLRPSRRPPRRTWVRVEARPYIPLTLGQKLLKALAYTTAFVAAYLLILLIGYNLVMGCGTATYYPNGTWQTGTCHPAWLFRDDVQSVRGTW